MTPETQSNPRQHRLSAHCTQRPIVTIGYVLTLALAMTIFFAWGSAQAQEITAPDESPPAWWMRGWEGEASTVPETTPAVPNATPRIADGADPDTWTKLVFQSYYQGNWDIMISSNDETTMSTLVAHPAADIRPRFGWEAKQVVFVSNRDGNWELYVINADGTGLKRLTQNSSVDTMPSWSPDGSRIAFSSNRSGQYQIYTMNPDGSDVVQLTSLPKDQVAPSWSKDNRIAWSQADQTTGILWIMNGDGSDQHAITPALPYLTNPIWSQDSVQLAFSYAAQNDGAYDVATIADNGSGMQQIAGSRSPNVDLIPTDWDMDPGESWYRILITQLQDAGGILLVNAHVLLQGGSSREMFYSPGKGFVDFEVADRTPPVSQIDPLPSLMRAGAYNVTASFRDIGPSGLWKVELQSRATSNDPWQNDYWNATESYLYQIAAGGTTVQYRMRGRDYAGNVEAWPPNDQAEAQTAFYSRKLTGQITDSRGNPLYWTPVSVSPAPVSAVQTDRQGMFEVGTNTTGVHTFRFDTGNSTDSPFFTVPIEPDRSILLRTSPEDNIIANGSFEAADGQELNAWSTVYNQDHSTRLAHQESQGAQLGDGCDPVLCVQEIQPEPIHSAMFAQMDSQDNLHVIWSESWGGAWHYKRLGTDGVWSDTQELTVTGFTFAFFVDSHDTLHLLSLDQYMVIHYSLSREGAWVNLGVVTNMVVQDAVAGMGADDVIHLVYASTEGVYPATNIWYQQVATTGVPSTKEKVSTVPWGTPELALTVSGDGTVHLLHSEGYGVAFYYHIRYSSGLWYEAEQPMVAGNRQLIRDFWTDRTNRVHLLWNNGGDSSARYSIRGADNKWSPYSVVSEKVYNLVHAEDRLGALHLVGCQYETHELSTKFALYQQLLPDGMTTDPLVFRDNEMGYLPCSQGLLFFDSSNQPHFLWAFYNSSWPGVWLHSTPGRSETSERVDALSQRVTIPSNMRNPTLSFFYQVWFARPTGASGSHLLVTVTDSVSETQVFSATKATDWILGWADLSPWAGQTVTVTFAIEQGAGDLNLRAFVDDVALGSWLTPMIYGVTPAQIDAGNAGTFRVVGINLMQSLTVRVILGDQEIPVDKMTWIDESTLDIDLPALGPGLYDLWVINPGGQQSVRVGAIRVGKQSFLPSVAK